MLCSHVTLPVQQGVPKLRAILHNSVKQMTRIITRCRAYVTGGGWRGGLVEQFHSLHVDRGIIVAGWTSTCNFPAPSLPYSPLFLLPSVKLFDKNERVFWGYTLVWTVDWPAAVFTVTARQEFVLDEGERGMVNWLVKRLGMKVYYRGDTRWRYSKDKSTSEWVKCVNRERC